MHIFDPAFPPSPHWPKQPPDARVEMYRQLQLRLGTERTVVVTPSTYGIDNSCTLRALSQLGACARGVAVVGADVSDAELDRLAAAGVCGLRLNFVSPQSWGTTTAEMLTSLSRRIARLNWHVQVLAQDAQWVELEGVLKELPTPIVIDHLGRIDPKDFQTSDAYAVIRRLLESGRTWMKLSGAYQRSALGAPNYDDVKSLGMSYVEAAPDRMLWGSDWPHTTEKKDSVNDADLVDVLYSWTDSIVLARTILVDNPAKLYGFE